MFKKSGRGFKKPFCINEKCPNFLPEDKRGYKRKSKDAAAGAETAEKDKEKPVKKTAATKTKSKDTSKRTSAGTRTSARSTSTRKSSARDST